MMKSRKTNFTISGTQSQKLTKLYRYSRGNLFPVGQSGDFLSLKMLEFYFVNIYETNAVKNLLLSVHTTAH